MEQNPKKLVPNDVLELILCSEPGRPFESLSRLSLIVFKTTIPTGQDSCLTPRGFDHSIQSRNCTANRGHLLMEFNHAVSNNGLDFISCADSEAPFNSADAGCEIFRKLTISSEVQ